MRHIKPPYRSICGLALIVFGGVWLFEPSEDSSQRVIMAQAAELSVPKTAAVERFDFALQDLQGWKTIDGQWAVRPLTVGGLLVMLVIQASQRQPERCPAGRRVDVRSPSTLGRDYEDL